MTAIQSGTQLAESIRVVYCMTKADFIEIYKNDGAYLWDKYVNHYDGNPAEFLCYLDGNNLRLLFKFILKRLTEMKVS